MKDKEKNNLLIEQLNNINKNLITLNKIMSVFLKFALDSSSYKSKTTDEIKINIQAVDERIKTMSDRYDV